MKSFVFGLIVLSFLIFGCVQTVPESSLTNSIPSTQISSNQLPVDDLILPVDLNDSVLDENFPEIFDENLLEDLNVLDDQNLVQEDLNDSSIEIETKQFESSVDDSRFLPAEFFASPGDLIEFIFNVETQNVYFNGSQVKSSLFDTGKILPGKSKTVSFTMPDFDLKLSSFWPASGVKKADAWIRIE